MDIISLNEAIEIVNKNIFPVERTENLKIKKLINEERVISEDIIANVDIPPFDRAAVDGYAVKCEDVKNASYENPVNLKLIGEIFAGKDKKFKINNGECMYVTTGSRIPEGADSVVMIEFTKKEDDNVKIFKSQRLFENIERKGEDIKKGEILIKKGEILTPAKIGVLCAIGRKNVNVFSIPKICVFSTGNEIVDVRENLKEGKIYDINTYTISSVVKKYKCIPVVLKIARDKEEIIEKRLNEALNYDCVVISGGTSVGEKDLLGKIIEKHGKILFHGIKIKPGKPTLFAKINEKPIFGMPGKPTSCLMNTYMFLVPAIHKMRNVPFKRKMIKAKISEKFVSKSDRDLLLPVKLEKDYAKPVFKTSGAITSMKDADGFIIVPASKTIEKDKEVEVYLFD